MLISSTPLRVSLFGGGTDQPEWFSSYDGAVVGGSIDKYVHVILSKRFDDKIVVGYSKQEEVSDVSEIQHDLIREAAKIAGMTIGWEVKTMSDIPSCGSGLGSSSAILVGLLKAFHEYMGNPSENFLIAKQAYIIEREILKMPVGKQDHYLTSLGGKRYVEFQKRTGAIFTKEIEFQDKDLYLFYTGISRSSTPILQEQIKGINGSTRKFYTRLAAIAGDFYISDYEKRKDLLPSYLKESWNIKKNLSPLIANDAIESMCKICSMAGETSYKILGAGGGGFLLVHSMNKENLRLAMKDYRELPFKFVNHGTRIIFNSE